MTDQFGTPSQNRLIAEVVKQFVAIGYNQDLLRRDYPFDDWFLAEKPQRVAAVVAFGRTPFTYDSTCFAVVASNGVSGKELVAQYRALGSPLAFEVANDRVTLWSVGRLASTTRFVLRFGPGEAANVFREHAAEWSPQSVLRAKNIVHDLGPRQLDFFDLGLIPALEEQITPKLDRLLRDVLATAKHAYFTSTGRELDDKQLFRLIFRLLAAKILHDREIGAFGALSESDAEIALQMVGDYYREPERPVLHDPATRNAAAAALWRSINFHHLSVEVLAYIYENTLVDETMRSGMATHSTPASIARYIVRHLPFENVPSNLPLIVEPCSGHGIFLVAALQRLRDLLPADMDEQQRHDAFVGALRGFELDAFAWEVSKLCLMLADFPNHNGWKLYNEDVFLSPRFRDSLQHAGVILCNPPYGKFSIAERAKYGGAIRSPYKKPVEILTQTLDHLPDGGMLGFVLPCQFVDGNIYASCRKTVLSATFSISDCPRS